MPIWEASGKPYKVTKRAKEVWVQGYYDGAGVRLRKVLPTRAACSAFAKELGSKVGTQAADADTFDELCSRFIAVTRFGREGLPNADPSTLEMYRSSIDVHLRPFFGSARKVADITKADMEMLLAQLVENCRARRTAQKIFANAKTIFNYAVASGMIDQNPAGKLHVHMGKRGQAERRVQIPSKADMKKLHKCAEALANHNNQQIATAWSRYYPLFVIMRFTGMRISEVLGLQWGDFSADYSQVTISRRVAMPRNFLSEDDRIGEPKTHNSSRSIPLSLKLAPVLERYRASPLAGEDWVFETKTKHTPLDYNAVRKNMWLRLFAHAEVPYFGMHAMRHYYASVLIQQGHIKELTMLLGHHSTAFTMDTYGHLIDDDTGARMRRIAEQTFAG